MAEYIDQTGRIIELPQPPRRIISLVPSQTELLDSLDLDNRVVGITKFCIHPDTWYNTKTRVGGTKQINFDTIDSLQPDLIIANKEENERNQVEKLAEKYPVWTSDISNLNHMYKMFSDLGIILDRQSLTAAYISQIRAEFSNLQIIARKPKAAYFIWSKPYMTVGSDTFIHSMMEIAGFENVFAHRSRYPEVTIDGLRGTGCELLLLSSEPFPFKQKHVEELQQLLPGIKIMLADGEMFSWYGTRLLHAASYFRELRIQARI